MTPIEIAPALEPDQWAERRNGSVFLDKIGGEPIVIVEDGDSLATVTGANEIFALIALANDALPDGDPRKIHHRWIADLRDAAHRLGPTDHAESLRLFACVLAALLPPVKR